VIREIRADGVTTTTYAYQPASGRLATVTDPKGQVTTYSYAGDDAVTAITFSNAAVPTPGVSYTYDPVYPRVTAMTDGTGATSYEYHPPGQRGAGQVASVEGPLPNDTIAYTYDVLGRVATRSINSVPLALTYDALGRVTREVNALGTFTYGYDGVSGRLASATYPNGQTSACGYRPALEDHRLQTIHHRLADLTTLSRFDHAYDGVGNILTWQQQAGAAAAVRWRYTGMIGPISSRVPCARRPTRRRRSCSGSPTGLTRRAIVCSSRSTTP
jgi:YD repeat-containing protein